VQQYTRHSKDRNLEVWIGEKKRKRSFCKTVQGQENKTGGKFFNSKETACACMYLVCTYVPRTSASWNTQNESVSVLPTKIQQRIHAVRPNPLCPSRRVKDLWEQSWKPVYSLHTLSFAITLEKSYVLRRTTIAIGRQTRYNVGSLNALSPNDFSPNDFSLNDPRTLRLG
jgi:hypothetical protein